jgi:hypothetical protein
MSETGRLTEVGVTRFNQVAGRDFSKREDMGDWGTLLPARVVGIDLEAASVEVAIAAPHRLIRAGRGPVAFQKNLGRSLGWRGQAS